MPPPLIGLVDCNHFYASCEKVFYPTAKDIIVGSNNDGCAIALSPGARKLVPMGAPLLKLILRIDAGGNGEILYRVMHPGVFVS